VKILKKEGVSTNDVVIIRSVDMRYVGQAYEINIPFKFDKISSEVSEMLIQTFNESYQNFYGHSTPKESTEIINFRVMAIGKVRKPPIEKISLGKSETAVKGTGEVYFKEVGWVSCPFYDREGLSRENKIRGPAIIEEYTSTTVIPPDVEATIDEYLNIVIRRVQG